MVITNTTAIDITCELDVNKNPVKGMQSRLTIRPGFPATVDVEHVWVLAQDLGFQAQIAAGSLTLRYTAADTAWRTAVLAFLNGTL